MLASYNRNKRKEKREKFNQPFQANYSRCRSLHTSERCFVSAIADNTFSLNYMCDGVIMFKESSALLRALRNIHIYVTTRQHNIYIEKIMFFWQHFRAHADDMHMHSEKCIPQFHPSRWNVIMNFNYLPFKISINHMQPKNKRNHFSFCLQISYCTRAFLEFCYNFSLEMFNRLWNIGSVHTDTNLVYNGK